MVEEAELPEQLEPLRPRQGAHAGASEARGTRVGSRSGLARTIPDDRHLGRRAERVGAVLHHVANLPELHQLRRGMPDEVADAEGFGGQFPRRRPQRPRRDPQAGQPPIGADDDLSRIRPVRPADKADDPRSASRPEIVREADAVHVLHPHLEAPRAFEGRRSPGVRAPQLQIQQAAVGPEHLALEGPAPIRLAVGEDDRMDMAGAELDGEGVRPLPQEVLRDGERAERAVSAAVSRVAHHQPLQVKEVPVLPAALVVGGGIAGIEAALRMADSGKKVYLVEREPSIGGYMAQLYKTFPTLDCSA